MSTNSADQIDRYRTCLQVAVLCAFSGRGLRVQS
ncbi:hypothetical protein FHT91_005227 [Rhizobium sp. BK347]|nr:hypothetical protein [Rhizobium sp. BK252]MBB3404854.1 hypothetical protein [Rhizobium sp. BK289]MBB3417268.1 hypothetical protein [Rhizobium sp. BK284]MBB3485430.1 hypothetical protein [Rhizobium sp. BK347]